MQIALSSLFLLLLILPGIIFRYFYRKGFWKSPVALSSFFNEFLYGIAFSLVIHLFIYKTILLLGYSYNFYIVISILAGNISDNNLLDISCNIRSFFDEILIYFLSIFLFSTILGLFLHSVIRELKLDLKFKIFRFKNDWYYAFYGEKSIIDNLENKSFIEKLLISRKNIDKALNKLYIFISVVVVIGEKQVLYKGTLQNFYFDNKGNLDRIVLGDVIRRNLEHDQDKLEELKIENPFYRVQGDTLVINYRDIKTLNLDYRFFIEEEMT